MTLFDSPALSRSTDPETSREAAATITGAIERDILVAYRWWRYGLTDDELCEYLRRFHPPTVKSARSRLTKAGRLVDSGQRRPSNRGRSMVVWRLA